MQRPENWQDVDRLTRGEGLPEPIRERIVRLAKFLDETSGVRADYQRDSSAPRVSFGAKLLTGNGPTLWFVGYRPQQDLPDLKVLPPNAGWPKLPQRVLGAFKDRLSAGGFPMDRIGVLIPFNEVNDTICDAIVSAMLLAVRAGRP